MFSQKYVKIKIIIIILILFSIENAHAEDTLTVLTPYFTVMIPDFYESEKGVTPSGYDSLYTDISDIMEDTQLNYMLWDFLGPYGEVFNTDIYIISDRADFCILRIEQQFSTSILFNEDGSGGVWSIVGLENTVSDWMPVIKINDGHYKTLSEDELAGSKTTLPEETIERAEEYINSRQIPTIYDEYVISAGIRIIWTADADTFETLLNFDYEYGD